MSSKPIQIDKIVVVPKQSKYELDLHRYKLTQEQLQKKYELEGVDAESILASHTNQQRSKEALRALLEPKNFVSRERLTTEVAEEADLIVSLGGDNHLQYLSHFVKKTLLLGLNSDPTRSEGALTAASGADFEHILKRLEKGDYRLEEWTRLEALVEDEFIPLASNEYLLGERERRFMSRYIVSIGGKEEEQKSSGLLVTTGVGSTGWYDSACRYLHPGGDTFGKTDIMAKFIATEPYRGRLSGYSMLSGRLEKGDELKVHSLNDNDGLLICDAYEVCPFKRGTTARIRISDSPLKVVRFDPTGTP